MPDEDIQRDAQPLNKERRLSLILPSAPVTKKNHPVLVRGSKIPRLFPSDEYRNWLKFQLTRKAALKEKLGVAVPIRNKCSIEATVYRVGDVGDWTGYCDAIADCLEPDVYKCQRPDKNARQKRNGKIVLESVCAKKIVTDEAPAKCPFCASPVPKKVRTGLGILFNDRLIEHWDGTRLKVDSQRPRIELIIRWTEEAPPQRLLFEGDEDDDAD